MPNQTGGYDPNATQSFTGGPNSVNAQNGGYNTGQTTHEDDMQINNAQNQAQQAASFINQANDQEQAQINQGFNVVDMQDPNRFLAKAGTAGPTPLAGLTTLGSAAQAGLGQAGLNNINTGQSNAILAGQLQNINALNRQAQGLGPSLAQEQAKQQSDQAIAAQMGMMGSQRGASNAALGLRASQMQGAQMAQQGVQQGMQGRIAEEMNAQQQLAGALQGTQGQVMQGAQAQAGMNQQVGMQNAQFANQQAQYNAGLQQQAMLQQGQMNQQVQLANQGMQGQYGLAQLSADQQTALANQQVQQQTLGMDVNEYNAMLQAQQALGNTNLTASENYAQLVAAQNTNQLAIAKNAQVAENANMMGLAGAGIAGGAGVVAGGLSASDRYLKRNVRSANRSVKDFLSQLGQL